MGFLLQHAFLAAARREPGRPAVESREGDYTSGELDDRSARVATLLATLGAGRGERVGLLVPKQHRCVAVMLGALRAGAAYVPVDPHAPARRAALILRDCGVRVLFATRATLRPLEEYLPSLPALRAVVLVDGDAEPAPGEPAAGPRRLGWSAVRGAGPAPPAEATIETDPAYLLYTSGSTGTPKGVILTHRNALAFVEWAATAFDVGTGDRLSNHAPLHFDLSVFDVHAALGRGACVVMVPERVATFPRELAAWIEREAITIWYSVPSALTRMLLHGGLERFAYPRLRAVLFAGEVFPVKYLRGTMERLQDARFFNLYGPTETNVCTWHEVERPLPDDADAIPIGRACANTDCFALTDDGTMAAPGETGELLVRGPTVMSGYWGLPERSRAALPADPRNVAWEERVYRTGDLVRVDERGEFWFVGRRDHMVKSRGYRIELGEIEQALLAHPDVREVAVVALPDEEIGARLIAVAALHPGAGAEPAAILADVGTRVPRYMVPESLELRPELPRTSTGKTDRPALARELA